MAGTAWEDSLACMQRHFGLHFQKISEKICFLPKKLFDLTEWVFNKFVYLTEWCFQKATFADIQVQTVSISHIELIAGSIQSEVSKFAVGTHGFDYHLTDCFTNLPVSCLSKLNYIPINRNSYSITSTVLSFPSNFTPLSLLPIKFLP
jgi:hypothetical protein